MKFSPMGIKNQDFNKSIRGFDRDEVQAFLDKLSDEFEILQKENEQLKKDFDAANIKLNEFRRIEKNLQNTLDRKSTRLNSSHLGISYAVFCLKKKTTKGTKDVRTTPVLLFRALNTPRLRN